MGKKKALILLVCVIIILGMTGCSNKEETWELINEQYDNIAELNVENKNWLFRFNNTLYRRSDRLIEFINFEKFGTITKVIDSNFVPKYNGETNNPELLNATIYNLNENNALVLYNDDYIFFEAIKETN